MKKYTEAEVEIIRFDVRDMITTSGPGEQGEGGGDDL